MDQNQRNKILLVTTRGCEGCAIMNKNIKEALQRTSKKIVYETIDIKDVDKSFRNANNLKDFPTIFTFRYGTKVRKEVGTRPTIVILRWFDIDFK